MVGNNVIPFRPLRRRAQGPIWVETYRRSWSERLDRLALHVAMLTQLDRETAMPERRSTLPIDNDATTLVITRTLAAPRALVWTMFSDPYHLAQWWGPKGFTNRVEKLDFRTGGSWVHVMIGPDGREFPTDNVILEVLKPERIVYRNAPADPKIFGDNPPPAFTKTVTFEEADGGTKTLLTLVASFDTATHREAVIRRGFIAGTNESFDKMDELLARP